MWRNVCVLVVTVTYLVTSDVLAAARTDIYNEAMHKSAQNDNNNYNGDNNNGDVNRGARQDQPEGKTSNVIYPAYSVDSCEINGTCHCEVSGNWTLLAEYHELQRIKIEIEEMEDKLEEHDTSYIIEEMEKLIERVEALEENLYTQSIAVSTKELISIQKSLFILTELVNHLNLTSSSQEEIIKMQEELAELSAIVEEMWARNPYATEEELLREIEELQARLANCHEGLNFTYFRGDSLPLVLEDDGFCDRSELSTVADALTHKWDESHDYGNWFKDPYPEKENNKTQIWLRYYSSRTYYYRFDNYDDFISDKNKYTGPYEYATGIGYTLYNGSIYYPYGQTIYKLTLSSGAKQSVSFPHSSINYYQQSPTTYVDIHSDEKGLWAIYTNTDNANKIMISLLDPVTMDIKRTWLTNKLKGSVCATFMICGKMYTLDDCRYRLSPGSHISQYVYDTNTGKDYYQPYHVTIKFSLLNHISYNPRERLLFGWDNGHLVTYQIYWKTIEA